MTTPLADLTTLRVGGAPHTLVTAETPADLIDAVTAADATGEPLLIVGGGSNIVVADDGFPGTVVLVRHRGIDATIDSCSGAWVQVQAGEPWDDLVARAVAEGWTGLEALSGIPGLTGATPIQNVGAYGQEVADTIARVTAFDGRVRLRLSRLTFQGQPRSLRRPLRDVPAPARLAIRSRALPGAGRAAGD